MELELEPVPLEYAYPSREARTMVALHRMEYRSPMAGWQLKRLMIGAGITRQQFADAFHISLKTTYNWTAALGLPRLTQRAILHFFEELARESAK